MVGAFGGGFVAAEEFEAVFAVCFFERKGEAAVFVHLFEVAVEFVFDAGDFEIEEGGFDSGNAHDLPHIRRGEADEVGFGFVLGVVAGDVGGEMVVVGGVVFGG